MDRMSHHLFQPLLYQAAAGRPIRGPDRIADSGAAEATAKRARVDGGRHRSRCRRSPSSASTPGKSSHYDSLILACGAETSYFGHDEWRSVSFGLKTLEDVVRLRSRIFSAFEEAERASDPADREEWLTFAVVGGGPTGVETSGVLAILAHDLRRDFSRADTTKAKVILVDAGERVVPAFSEKLSAKAAEELASLGVTVREGLRATAIDDRGLTVKTGEAEERINARTVIWAAGVGAAPLTEAVARATGANTDRGGRIEVNPDCTIPGHPEISAIGDMASHPGADGKPLPGLATVAIQQARHVAKGDSGRTAGGIDSVSLLRQGCARGRRTRQGGLRGEGARDLRSPRLLHVSQRSSVLSQRRAGQPTRRHQGLDRSAIRCAGEPGDRGPVAPRSRSGR